MIKDFNNFKPIIDKTVFVHNSAQIIGKVKMNKNSSVWPNAVLRGDIEEIIIGKNTNIQDCAVLHTDHNFPTIIGNYVTVGHSVILHGCKIGDNCLIGMGTIVLPRKSVKTHKFYVQYI